MNKDELTARCEVYYKKNFPGVDAVDGLPGLEAFARALVVRGMEEASNICKRLSHHERDLPPDGRIGDGSWQTALQLGAEIDDEIQRIKEGV